MSYCLVPMTVQETQDLLGPSFTYIFQSEIDSYLFPFLKNVSRGRPLSMGKELWEYAVADSIIGAEWCGAGKSIIDVRVGDNIGIDVKSVQKGPRTTTEASMYQYLQVTSVADHFSKQNKQALWDMFVARWLEKVCSVENYYLLTILRNKETLQCSIVGFKVDNRQLDFALDACDFSRESMKINSIVDPRYMDVKIYKGKTRMEMRVKEEIFNNPDYAFEIYRGMENLEPVEYVPPPQEILDQLRGVTESDMIETFKKAELNEH